MVMMTPAQPTKHTLKFETRKPALDERAFFMFALSCLDFDQELSLQRSAGNVWCCLKASESVPK